jgi:hypothetical protein
MLRYNAKLVRRFSRWARLLREVRVITTSRTPEQERLLSRRPLKACCRPEGHLHIILRPFLVWMQPSFDIVSGEICPVLVPSMPSTSLVTLRCIRVDAVGGWSLNLLWWAQILNCDSLVFVALCCIFILFELCCKKYKRLERVPQFRELTRATGLSVTQTSVYL